MSEDPHLARWNARFGGEHYHFGTAPNEFLVGRRGLLEKGMRALALADGEGRNGVWLAEQGLDVLSVDFSPAGLEKAARLAASRGVRLRFERADLGAWTWPEAAFDVVVGIFIQFASPPVRDAIFAGVRRTLVAGGFFILEGYGQKQLAYGTGGPSQIEHLYTVEMLRDAFGDWEILTLEEREAELHEGAGHDGRSALVDLVARKP